MVLLLVGARPGEGVAQGEPALHAEEDGRRVGVLLSGQRVGAVSYHRLGRGQIAVPHRHRAAAAAAT